MSEKEYRAVLHTIDLEISNICNNACTICPRERISRPKGIMRDKTFTSFVEALKGYNPLITISGMGDPLTHPDCASFIRELKKCGFKTGIVINIASLVKMSEKHIEDLVNSSPNQITLSVPSIRKNVLTKICPGIDIDMVEPIIRRLVESCYGKVGLRVSGILTRINRDEKEEYRRFFSKYGISIWTSKIHSRGGNLTESDLYYAEKIEENSFCNLFVFHTFVTHNGDILACCHDLSCETKIGDIYCGFESILDQKSKIIKHKPYFLLCNRCDEPLRFIRLPAGYERISRDRFIKRLRDNF